MDWGNHIKSFNTLFQPMLNYCRKFEDVKIRIFKIWHCKVGPFLGDTQYVSKLKYAPTLWLTKFDFKGVGAYLRHCFTANILFILKSTEKIRLEDISSSSWKNNCMQTNKNLKKVKWLQAWARALIYVANTVDSIIRHQSCIVIQMFLS